MAPLTTFTVVTCEECTKRGIETPGTIADHIKPLSHGGTAERSNYQLLCKDCWDIVCAIFATASGAGFTGGPRRPRIS